MANWQDDPDLAGLRPRRGNTPWGRILVGVLFVGCGTFALAYYLPLYRAHHALSDDHARLREKLESVEQTLAKAESDLKSVTAKRDELATSAEQEEAKRSKSSSDFGSLKDALANAVDKAIKKKAGVVGADPSGARVALAAGQVFSPGKLDVSASGAALLCAVAKAGGSRALHVTGVATDADVPAQLKTKYASAWEYTAAAAAAVAETLHDKCSVPGTKLYAEATDGSRPSSPAFGGSAPSPRIELAVTNDAKP
jgi:flagellar motor protein MotB